MRVSKDYFLTHRDFIEYVADSNNGDDIPMMHFSSVRCEVFSKKITITYEVDRKVEITESQLEEAFKDISVGGHSLVKLGVFNEIKKKLFGDSNEQ